MVIKMIQVVNADIKKVPRNVYRLVRSFIDSSLSDKYHWNTGIKLSNLTTFVKFRRWRLKIYEMNNGISIELCGYGAKIVYDPDFLLEISIGKEVVLKLETDNEAIKTYIESDGPYMEPLPLIDMIEKLDHYIDAVMSYTKTVSDQEQKSVCVEETPESSSKP